MGILQRKVGSRRPSKVTAEIKALVEQQMRHDDETLAHQFHGIISREGYTGGGRRRLGWAGGRRMELWKEQR